MCITKKWRAQPRTGSGLRISHADRDVVAAARETCTRDGRTPPLYIVDARPRAHIALERSKGRGTETSAYRGCVVEPMGTLLVCVGVYVCVCVYVCVSVCVCVCVC